MMTTVPPDPAPAAPRQDDRMRASARALEAGFLAEMLKSAGYAEAREAFGGGIGEEQFLSFLRAQTAEALAARGGIGLADSIYRSLAERGSDAP